jgi:hypothetical protein
LEEVDLHTPKPPKRHIKHEFDAHLSTPPLLAFLLWYLPNISLKSKVLSAESLIGVLVFYHHALTS